MWLKVVSRSVSRIKGSSQFDPGRKVSVKNLLRKLIGWLRGKRSGLALLTEPQAQSTNAIPTPVAMESKVHAVIWTVDEAEAAWRAGRTRYNLGETFRRFAKSLESMAGRSLVDGDAVRVVVCVNEEVKKRILSVQSDKIRVVEISKDTTAKAEQARKEERRERDQWAKVHPDPEPIEGRTCGACGGKLVLVILNYYCEPSTDVITPADKVEKCLSCGRLTCV